MVINKNKRTRIKLKLLIKYRIYFSIRLLNNNKLVNKNNFISQFSIKQKIINNIKNKRSGWNNSKIKILRNNLFIISKNSVYINKKFKTLLLCKQKFYNSFFLTNYLMCYLFKYNNNNFKKLICRIDFLLLRIFSFPSLFYIRKLILNRFVKIDYSKKYVVKINYIIHNGELITVIKNIFHPKIKSYDKKITSFKYFNTSNIFLLFGIDINYKTQSFVLNIDFIDYFEIFSSFYGILFSKYNIVNFYNR